MTGSIFLYYDIFCGGEFTNEIFGCCKVIVGSIPNCLIECLARNPTLMVRWPHIFYTDVELFCVVSHASNCTTEVWIIPDWRIFAMFLIYEWKCRWKSDLIQMLPKSHAIVGHHLYIVFRNLICFWRFYNIIYTLTNICIVVMIFIQA